MKPKHFVMISAGFVCVALVVVFVLVWNGVILLNRPSVEEYPVRGVDVSAYQGTIDWESLAAQGISFAYIKATEGSTFVDQSFAYNYEQAQQTKLRVGAYHFFSFDSAGKTQAEHFISTVAPTENMLPPAVDVEFYADKEKNPPEASLVRQELDQLLEQLEAHYGLKPLIYSTEKAYTMYLANAYDEYDIWIRNVVTRPRLSDGRDWTFWQYTNRARLNGYHGREKYIDMNVFCKTQEEFEDYGKPESELMGNP